MAAPDGPFSPDQVADTYSRLALRMVGAANPVWVTEQPRFRSGLTRLYPKFTTSNLVAKSNRRRKLEPAKRRYGSTR